jgi:hypothetical protein
MTAPPSAGQVITSSTATLSNPFPNGFTPPYGSSLGLLTNVNGNATFLDPNVKNPYSMRWNMGVQHQLSTNTMLEVLYIGNHSVHLPVDLTQLNGIPRQYLSTLATRDPNQSYLTASVPNPFAGLSTGTTTTFSSTTSPVQFLARYPEFTVGDSSTGWNSSGVLEENNNVGSSYFDSLNIGLTRRISQGFQLHVNYIKSRLIEFDSWLNDSDARPERRDSPSDHPNRLVIFWSLPTAVRQRPAFQYQLEAG